MHSSCILYEDNLDFQYEFKLKAHQKFLKIKDETNQGSCGVARSMPRTLANSIVDLSVVETTDTVGWGINETEVFIAFKSRKTRAFYVMVRARHYLHALLHCQGIPEVS